MHTYQGSRNQLEKEKPTEDTFDEIQDQIFIVPRKKISE